MVCDPDMHGENIGVMIVDDQDEQSLDSLDNKNKKECKKAVFAKIDHGRSGTSYFTSANYALHKLAETFDPRGFNYIGLITLNIEEFKKAIDELLNISEEEIEEIIDKRVFTLERLGLDLTELEFRSNTDDQCASCQFDTFDDLKKYYVKNFAQQRNIMRDISNRLGVIAKIKVSDDPQLQEIWRNHDWLWHIRGNDPLEWFLYNDSGRQIANLNPDLLDELIAKNGGMLPPAPTSSEWFLYNDSNEQTTSPNPNLLNELIAKNGGILPPEPTSSIPLIYL